MLYVSIARYLTPDHAQVEGVGIAPDIEIAIPDTGFEAGQDIQLYVAIEYLRGEYNPSGSGGASQSEAQAGASDDQDSQSQQDAAEDSEE